MKIRMLAEISSHTFDDVDEFREHLNGWNCDITQLSRGSLRLRVNQVAFDDLVIRRLVSVGSYSDSITIDPGWQSFTVCISGSRRLHWCGLEIPGGSLIVEGPGREHRAKAPERLATLGFLVADRLLDRLGVLDGVDLPLGPAPEQSVLPLNGARLARFRVLAQLIRSWGGTGDAQASAHDLRQQALKLLSSSVRHGATRARATPPIRRIPRYELARRALKLLDADGEAPFNLNELAASLGTTPRAIQYAFRSAIGVSPYQYMMVRKLQSVRRELVHNPADEAPVTVAAYRHGIANLRRMTQQYQRLFGETPRQTLSRVGQSGNGSAA